MTHKVTINFKNRDYTIDADLFKQCNTDARRILGEIAELNEQMKDLGDKIELDSGFKASNAIKYFKTRHNDKLHELNKTTELFKNLTEILDGPNSQDA